MFNTRDHIRQYITVIIVQIITLLVLGNLKGLQIQSIFSVLGITLAYLLAQMIYWWSFINFFSYLPAWLYPLITFILSGSIMMFLGNLIPGIIISDIKTSLRVVMILTGMSGILAGIMSLDIDQQFDRFVTKKLVAKHEKPEQTEVPGFLFLEIDGLGEKAFQQAIKLGKMPTLKRWYDEKTHQLIQWETDFTSQTGSMQSGILFGNNTDIPAYRWWDRKNDRTVRSGNFWDADKIEKRLSNGHGLLAYGGTSRANMFSGDASESLFTLSMVLNRSRETGPGFYMYLVNPFVIAHLFTNFIAAVFKEWGQALRQKLRRDIFIVNSRNFFYAFIRAADAFFLQDITTLLVSNDLLRGMPAIYATYSGYDNVGHYAGSDTPEALDTLKRIDRDFARLEHLAQRAPRPYHIIVLSDHGQSTGGTFRKAQGISLEQLVKSSINEDSKVIATSDINEAWDHINTFLSDSIQADSRLARVLRTMVRSKIHNGLVEIGKNDEMSKTESHSLTDKDDSLIVYGSGSAGLIYFRDSEERLTYEDIQQRCPDLILTLLRQPGIGFIVVRSSENGDLVLGKSGIYFLNHNTFEGRNPLADFSLNAVQLLKRESSFPNCPDIIVNTSFDPETGYICTFENQVSHHGGLGGEQSHPFIFFPSGLSYDEKPLIGAESVYHLLRGWRKEIQAIG
jgi:putative membrane protein